MEFRFASIMAMRTPINPKPAANIATSEGKSISDGLYTQRGITHTKAVGQHGTISWGMMGLVNFL